MKIQPFSNHASKLSCNTNFKGVTQTYTDERPYILLSPLFYPDSTVEKTLDTVHHTKTGKIYFADPMEPINDEIKNSVDYVVYDNEPSYPDIKKDLENEYIGKKSTKNNRQQFVNINKYFARREKGGWSDNEYAKYQQWQSAECIKIYDKAKTLISERDSLQNTIKYEQSKFKDAQNSISLTRDFLESSLERLENAKKLPENTLAKKEEKYQKILSIQDRIINLYKEKERLEASSVSKTNLIQDITKKVNELNQKLLPLFNEIKTFYEEHNIGSF